MSSEIKEKLKKIYTLSVEGSDGERAAAQTQLDRLLEKYGLVLSDIVDEARDYFTFTFKNKTELRLLRQIVGKVINSNSVASYGRERNTRYFKLTKAENAEIKFLYSEYRNAYKKEMEIFFQAFVQKNRLFAETTEESEQKELSLEERQRILKILEMSRGMDKVPVNRKRLN